LSMRARRSLIFVEPTWLGFTPDSPGPDAEADLLILLDGNAWLCEIKASWRSLRPSHIVDFVALARRLRPDTALLAVMEAGPSELQANIAAATAQLAAEGIEFELLTLDSYRPADDPTSKLMTKNKAYNVRSQSRSRSAGGRQFMDRFCRPCANASRVRANMDERPLRSPRR